MFAADHRPQRHPITSGFKLMTNKKCPAPCECRCCEQQFLAMEAQRFDRFRYETIVKPEIAQTTLADFVDKIKENRAHLTNLCDKFGNLILSRWKKKSRDKREALLLAADPTLKKEPWFRLRTEGEAITWQEVRPLRSSWLLPYLSTATLKANPSVLLGLLHNRVMHSPEEWAPFDSEVVRQGWADGYFDLEYCGYYCVVMHGINYGKLVPWDKEAAERCDIVGYPRARLLIEAQALMFSRLRAIVDLILEGVNHDGSSACDKWLETIRTGFKQSNNIEFWSDYVNQPFSSPPKLDVDYYCSIAKARMQAAKDHLWLLQTDPSYFRRFVKVLAVGEVYKTVWRYVLIVKDIHQVVMDYLRWRELSEEWSTIQDYYRRFRDNIHPGQPLPHRLECSLYLLEGTLIAALDRRARHLNMYVAQRPGFQHFHKFTVLSKPPSRPGQHMFNREDVCKSTSYQFYREDPLYWTLMQLQSQSSVQFRFDHSELFARLEAHLAEASPEERARLDETVYAKMSDFAAQHEMLSAIKLHRPASARRGLEDTLKMMEEISTPSNRGSVVDATAHKLKSYTFPTDRIKLFEQSVPAVGRKDEAWLDRRTTERRILTEFWKQASDSLREELTFTSMNQEELDDSISSVTVSTSPEYAEIVEKERLQVLDAIAAAAVVKTDISTINLHEGTFWETGPDLSKLDIKERAPKPKTRPLQPAEQRSNEEVLSEPTTDADSEPVIQRISTTPRALEIIRKMFPTSAEEAAAKTTEWDHFVHAMNDLGLNARNVGGSAVEFEHPALERKINFHRPHPVAKIDSIMLQSMGKRLRKHFDWSREVFVGV
ncbi:hypothetical protein KCU95_g8131, partial [Aureobasidium melanogenum]